MLDDLEIRRTAAEHIRLRGPRAIDWLIEQAELDKAKGDADAVKTWGEIAAATACILKSQSEQT
jgi:hypothetical protein